MCVCVYADEWKMIWLSRCALALFRMAKSAREEACLTALAPLCRLEAQSGDDDQMFFSLLLFLLSISLSLSLSLKPTRLISDSSLSVLAIPVLIQQFQRRQEEQTKGSPKPLNTSPPSSPTSPSFTHAFRHAHSFINVTLGGGTRRGLSPTGGAFTAGVPGVRSVLPHSRFGKHAHTHTRI